MKGVGSHGSCKNYYKDFVISSADMPDVDTRVISLFQNGNVEFAFQTFQYIWNCVKYWKSASMNF